MKVKTSVTLSEELLEALAAGAEAANRSALIERATWEYLKSRRRANRDVAELGRINAQSASLNSEALDAIGYQIDE